MLIIIIIIIIFVARSNHVCVYKKASESTRKFRNSAFLHNAFDPFLSFFHPRPWPVKCNFSFSFRSYEINFCSPRRTSDSELQSDCDREVHQNQGGREGRVAVGGWLGGFSKFGIIPGMADYIIGKRTEFYCRRRQDNCLNERLTGKNDLTRETP